MRRFGACLCLLAMTLAAQSHDWIIVPGERVGPITRSSTMDTLKQQFGAANVIEKSIATSEDGIERPTAIVYPDAPARTLAIVWGEGDKAGHPDTVIVCYQMEYKPELPCDWKTAEGITKATTMQQLERLNGRMFRILGFGVDNGGAVTSWGGGRLESLKDGGVLLRLTPDPAAKAQPSFQQNFHQVQSDRFFSSGHPAMQALNPRVDSLVFSFAK